jgi:ADP-heptose:LPS heptosyltransferase
VVASGALAVRRIAVVRALYLGDLVMALPALRALRHAFPLAEITFVGLPWAEQMVSRTACVDRFVEFPGWPDIPEVDYQPRRTSRFIENERARQHDLAIQLHGDGTAMNGFVGCLGARQSVGFSPYRDEHRLTDPIAYPGNEVHEGQKLLNLLATLGIKVPESRPQLNITPADLSEFRRRYRADSLPRPLIGIHPGAKSPARIWAASRWAEVIRGLQQEVGGSAVVMVGPGEEDLGARIQRLARPTPVRLLSQLSFAALASAISALDLFLGNDSGPLHLAEALGVHSVGLYARRNIARWGPFDSATQHVVVAESCEHCGPTGCPRSRACMERVEPDQVVETALQATSSVSRLPAPSHAVG